MAKIFPSFVRRIVQLGSGNGFIASVVGAGIQLLNRLSLVADVAAGVSVDASRQGARVDQAPGIGVEALGAIGTAGPQQLPAVGIGASIRDVAPVGQAPGVVASASLMSVAEASHVHLLGVDASLLGVDGMTSESADLALACSPRIAEHHRDANPACEIVRVVYDLTRRVGANASANVTGTWTNLTNCQGVHDGASATSAGAALGASRKLRGDYANSSAKGDLTITAFRLHFYAATTGDATGLLSDATLSYNVGAGEVTLEAIAGNFDNLTTPRTYDLFAAGVDSWAEYDALQAFVLHEYAAASIGVTCSVDAIEVEVIATRTDTP